MLPPMPDSISAPTEWIASISELKFPASTDHRIQVLMDRNNEGRLDAEERQELEALVDMSEELSLLRAQALRLLNRSAA